MSMVFLFAFSIDCFCSRMKRSSLASRRASAVEVWISGVVVGEVVKSRLFSTVGSFLVVLEASSLFAAEDCFLDSRRRRTAASSSCSRAVVSV